jgi:hypothetical protein
MCHLRLTKIVCDYQLIGDALDKQVEVVIVAVKGQYLEAMSQWRNLDCAPIKSALRWWVCTISFEYRRADDQCAVWSSLESFSRSPPTSGSTWGRCRQQRSVGEFFVLTRRLLL